MEFIKRYTFILLVLLSSSYNTFGQNQLPVIKSMVSINDTTKLPFSLNSSDLFGRSMFVLDDLDSNGYREIAVGAPGTDSAGINVGAVYVLYMDTLDTIVNYTKILPPASVSTGSGWGAALTSLGDLNNDGFTDLIVGAPTDSITASNPHGSFTILYMNDTAGYDSYIYTRRGINGIPTHSWLNSNDQLGGSLAPAGDVDFNGVQDLIVGLPGEDTSNPNLGAFVVVRFNSSYEVIGTELIGTTALGIPAHTEFGKSVTNIGDIDGNGVDDFAVGGWKYRGKGTYANSGSVWIVKLDTNGTLLDYNLISMPLQGASSYIYQGEYLGISIASLGDINGDGYHDLAVGGSNYDVTGATPSRGAIYIMSINNDGELVAIRKWASDNSGFTEDLPTNSWFGTSTVQYDDTDEDGIGELYVGAYALAGEGGIFHVKYEFIDQTSTGTVSWQNAVHEKSGFADGATNINLNGGDYFGYAVRSAGDIDQDGYQDAIVGVPYRDAAGTNRGAVVIVSFDSTGQANKHKWISDSNFPSSEITNHDYFGMSVDTLGDFDGNGINDLLVGAPWDDEGGTNTGTAYMVFMDTASGVLVVDSVLKIHANTSGFSGQIQASDEFGFGLTALGDLDGDGVTDIAVGARRHNGGSADKGAVWVIFLNSDGSIKSYQKINDGTGGLNMSLVQYGMFGQDLDGLGDIDGDGIVDLLVGYRGGTSNHGAAIILNLDTDGTVKDETIIDNTVISDIGNGKYFGGSVSHLPDVNGDGFDDILVGAQLDDAEGTSINSGAVWVICIDSSSSVVEYQKIDVINGNFTTPLRADDRFGYSVGSIGDVNFDGKPDIAAGAILDDWPVNNGGALHVMGLKIKKSLNAAAPEANLRRKLDGSYYIADEGILRFRYIEEYNDRDLVYRIFRNPAQDIVVTEADINIPVQFGDNNVIELDFSTNGHCLSDGFYILEVEDAKGKIDYLRFKRDGGGICPQPPGPGQ